MNASDGWYLVELTTRAQFGACGGAEQPVRWVSDRARGVRPVWRDRHWEFGAVARLEAAGVECWQPMASRIAAAGKRGGVRRRRSVRVPLFPGYLFVRFDGPIDYRLLGTIDGVRGLVLGGPGADGVRRPALVRDAVVRALAAAETAGAFREGPETVRFAVGSVVLVASGVFAGWTAEIVEPVTATDDLADVELSLFGRATRVTIETAALAAA